MIKMQDAIALNRCKYLYLIGAIILFPILGMAQEGVVYSKRPYWQAGFTAGRFLPFGIVGVRDNYAFTGAHLSHPTRVGYLEYMLLSGNSNGVTYYNGSASVRIDYTAYDIVDGFFTMGFSLHTYKRRSTRLQEFDFVNVTGIHAGFGFTGHIVGPIHARADLKFNINPGRSIYFGVGLVYRFGVEGNEN